MPGDIQVSRTDISRQGAESTAEVLERTPFIYATTGGRNERILTVRGFDQLQTAVLIDGAQADIAYDGQADLAMVPAELVESITISRGPGTIGLGTNGLGPTISINTLRPGAGPFLTGRLETDFRGTFAGSLSHSQRLENVAYTVYGGGENSDSFPLSSDFAGTKQQPAGDRLNSDRRNWYGGGSVLLTPAIRHEVTLSASYIDGDKGVPPTIYSDTTPRYWRFNVWRSVTASAEHAYHGDTIDLDEIVYSRIFDNLLNGYDDATYSTQNGPNAFHSWYHDGSDGLIVRLRSPLPSLLDMPLRLRVIASANYDYHTENDYGTKPPLQRALLTAAPEIFADIASQLLLTLGCQFDDEIPLVMHQQSPSPTGIGPLASLRYEPMEGMTIAATVARRHRFPSLKEQFSTAMGGRIASPDLRPEADWYYDLDVSYALGRAITVDASAFDAEVTDLIEPVPLPATGGMSQLQNIPGLSRLAGGELEARIRIRPYLRADLGYAYLYAHSQNQQPTTLPYRPAHKVGAGLVGTPWPWLELSTYLRFIGEQAFQNPGSLAWGTLGSYMVWDAHIEARPWPEVAIYARATNLLDTFYQTQYGYPDPGRCIWVGVRVGFDRSDF